MAVYFIQAGTGPVKIGVAVDPEARLRALQTGHHELLRLIRIEDGGSAEEAWLHQRFAALRLRGEWFKFTEEMLTIAVRHTTRLAKEKTDFDAEPFDGPLDDVDVLTACAEIEVRLRRANITVAEMCERANIHRATWQRWKKGGADPHLTVWRRVLATLPEEAS